MDSSKTTVGIFAGLCAGALAAGLYLFSTPAAESTLPDTLIAAPQYGGASPLAESAPVPEETVLPVEAAPRQVATRQQAPRRVARRVAAPGPSAPVADRTQVAPQPAEAPRLTPPAQPAAPRTKAEYLRDVNVLPTAAIETPPPPSFVDLIVPAESVIGLQVETALTSETARVEDEVTASITRDVRVDDRVVIPAGAIAHGEVTLVERGGRVRDRARLGIRFNSVVLANGTRIPLDTETIYRDGAPHTGENAAKIGGGAIGGAILGGLLGGAKGAIIGGSVGAGAGTAAVYASGRNAATLPSGTPLTVRLVEPVIVTVEH